MSMYRRGISLQVVSARRGESHRSLAGAYEPPQSLAIDVGSAKSPQKGERGAKYCRQEPPRARAQLEELSVGVGSCPDPPCCMDRLTFLEPKGFPTAGRNTQSGRIRATEARDPRTMSRAGPPIPRPGRGRLEGCRRTRSGGMQRRRREAGPRGAHWRGRRRIRGLRRRTRPRSAVSVLSRSRGSRGSRTGHRWRRRTVHSCRSSGTPFWNPTGGAMRRSSRFGGGAVKTNRRFPIRAVGAQPLECLRSPNFGYRRARPTWREAEWELG